MAKQTREEYQAVTDYVSKLAQEGVLHRSLYKAGIDQQMILDDMAQELALHKIEVSSKQLQAGGLYGSEIKTYHEGHKRWEKDKGWALIHNDGTPVLECQNYTDGHDKTSITYDVEECMRRGIIPSGSVNEQGWRTYESLPGSAFQGDNSNVLSIDSEEFKARQAERMEQNRLEQEAKAAELAQKREIGTQTAQERYDKALKSHANDKQRREREGRPTVEAHGNHHYSQGKFKGHLDNYSEYLNDWAMDSIHYLASDNDIYPVLIPARDMQTGEVSGLQRIMADKERIEAEDSPTGKVQYIPKLKEDGSPKLAKKFQADTGPVGNYGRVYNDPSPDTELYLIGEGPVSTIVGADLFEIGKRANADKAAAISSFTAGNLAATVALAREKSPDALIIISADNDFKNGPENNAGLKAAYKAAEESNAIVVFPPQEYLKHGQSDWDDVNSNIYDVLAGKLGTEPTYEEVHKVSSTIYKQQLAKAMVEYNKQQEEVLSAAEEVIQSAQPRQQAQQQSQPNSQAAPAVIEPADAIMLASQNDEFKKLTINALKTVSVMTESQHWENPAPLVSLLERTDINDGSLDAMEAGARKSLMRQASSHLGEMLTDNKKYDSEGNDNLSTMQLVSQKGWDVNSNYATSFTSNLAGNLKEGQQAAKMPEPEYLTNMLHQTVAAYQTQNPANAVKKQPVAQQQASVTHQEQAVTHQGKPVVHNAVEQQATPVAQQQASVTHQGQAVTHQGKPVVHNAVEQQATPVESAPSPKDVFSAELRGTYGLMGNDVEVISSHFTQEEFKENVVDLKERYKVKDVHAVLMVLDMAQARQKKQDKEVKQSAPAEQTPQVVEANTPQNTQSLAAANNENHEDAPRPNGLRRKM